MKNRIIFIAFLAIMTISCAKEVLQENNPEEKVELKLVPMEFTTAFETKAGIVDGEKTVEWAADDAITIFDNLGGKNTFTTATGGTSSVFTGQVTEGATKFYALYPQRTGTDDVKLDAEKEVINSKLFPNQNAVCGSYAKGNGGAVMVAEADADNRLSFKNMTSHVRFTLAEDMTDVKSITLMGNRNEILAGTYNVDFSGDEPVLTVDKPETYVTLSRADGEALEPGNYFFTILPVEFTEGFTVILSKKTDGSQVAKTTSKPITSLNTRNKVLPMAPLASSDYKSHMNYFVRYNDGFDITVGGYTFNNKTHEGAKLVNDTYGNTQISKDGVYFIDSFCKSAVLTKNAYSSLILVGSDNSVRTSFTFGKTVQPTEGGSEIVFVNLDCKVRASDNSVINAFNQPSSGGFANFSDIVLYDSHFRNIGTHFMHFNRVALETLDVCIEDCEFGFNSESVYLFNSGSNASMVQNLKFANNIFYSESGTVMTAFRFVNGDALSVDTFNIDDNTCDATVFDGRTIRIKDFVSTLRIYQNLFVNCTPSADVKLVDLRGGTQDTVTGNVSRNYYYTTGAALKPGIGASTFPNAGMTIISPATLGDTDPLSASWSPADNIFGPYTFPEGVSAMIGAYRDDMQASAATANYAAVNYVSVDYGTF